MMRDIFKRSLWICFMVGGLLITESSALLCRFCEQATSLDQCLSGYECGPGIGCFSQTWVNDAGQRYYRKGCQQPSVVNCEVANDAFCTKDLALICCDTYLCNAPDPQLVWRPEPPRNFVASAINPTSITLQWDIQCNGIYAYEVTYDRNTPVSSTLEDINGQQVTISNLTPGSLYKFSIRSVFDGSYSDPVDIIRATPHDNSTQTICAESVNVTLNDVSSTTLRLCGPDEQKCFVGLHYWQNGGETYVSQGCVATELCDHIEANFRNDCIPGSVNSLCFICCEGNTCNNNNDLINSNFSCNVENDEKVDCGWDGIDRPTCESRGCCYARTESNIYDKWCHHKTLGTPEPIATAASPLASAGIAYWLIIVIVLGVFLFFIITLLIVCCVVRKRQAKKRGFYEVDPVYAIPNRATGRRVTTISGISNPNLTVQETA